MGTSTTAKRFISILIVGWSFLLSACLGPVFPTDNPLPYPESKYTLVEVGSSSQDEVLAALGKPQLELRGGELWIYGRSRAKLSDGLGSYRHDYQAIFVEYADGIVVAKDILHSDQPHTFPSCWSDEYNLCLHPYWENTGSSAEPRRLSRKQAAVTSSGEDDRYAKTFELAEGRCLVYVVPGSSFFRHGIPVVSLQHMSDEPIPTRGYLFLESSPGNLRLQAGKNKIDISCQPDHIHFYKVETLIFDDPEDIDIDLMSFREGRESVLERQIIVTW